MDDKLKLVNKISSVSMFFFFVGIIGSIFLPVFKYITLISSCCFYLCTLIKNRIKKGKFDFILIILCSASLIWVFLREFFNSPYVNVFGFIIVYAFLTWSFKSNTGNWNKFVIGYGTIVIILSIFNIYRDSTLLNFCILALQFVIIFKFIDPILEKIGLEHRRKRLAYEAELKRQEEESSAQNDHNNVS